MSLLKRLFGLGKARQNTVASRELSEWVAQAGYDFSSVSATVEKNRREEARKREFGGITKRQIDATLFEALEAQKFEEAQLALKTGADPNALNFRGQRPIHCAFPFLLGDESKTLALVELLVKFGADVNAVSDNPGKWTPLHQAAFYKFPRVVKLLLDRGANPSAMDPEGLTVFQSVLAKNDFSYKEVLYVLVRETKEGRAWLGSIRGKEWMKATGFQP